MVAWGLWIESGSGDWKKRPVTSPEVIGSQQPRDGTSMLVKLDESFLESLDPVWTESEW